MEKEKCPKCDMDVENGVCSGCGKAPSECDCEKM